MRRTSPHHFVPKIAKKGSKGLHFDDFLVPLADYQDSGQGTVLASTLQDFLSNKRLRTEAAGVGTDAAAGPAEAVSVTRPEINPKNAAQPEYKTAKYA